MNRAAQLAAFYKKKVAFKAQCDLEVKKAQLEVQAQQQVVENFKKQLREAERVLRAKQAALVKKQSEDLQAPKKAAPKKEKAAPKKPHKTKCLNCVKLPKQYSKMTNKHGEKGSCADCGDWAAQGYCTSKKFGAF